jgi:hypothetical protein
VWPEAQASVVSVVGDAGQYDLIVIDERSGLPYLITGRETPSGSNTGIVWKDKVDSNITDSGSDIATSATLREHYGEKMGFVINHEQSRIHVRPVKNENRNATGFNAIGVPDDIEFNSTYYADGAVVASCEMVNVATDAEYVHSRKFKGHALRQKISTNKSNYRVIRTETVYKVSDTQKIPSIGTNTESGYELELAAPIVWLSRGATLLRNRYDNNILDGAVTATTGPDGLSDSAMTVTSLSLANSAVSNGTIMLLSTSAYVISGITLATYDTITVGSTTWYLRYATGSLPALITLGAGVVFDLRLFTTVITNAALAHYLSDISNNEGQSYLPMSG